LISRYYNHRHNWKGFSWGDRFKSVIFLEGCTLVNLLAYVDLNPVNRPPVSGIAGVNRDNPIRAGIVKRPEDYRLSSLGYFTRLNAASWQPSFAGFNRASVQTGNKDELLSLDFGLRDWEENDPLEIVRKYRQFVYETGAVDAGKCAAIDRKIVDKERKEKYKIRRVDRFLYHTGSPATPASQFLLDE